MPSDVEIDRRSSAYVKARAFCPFGDENDMIEVTEWSNGDGIDIHCTMGSKLLALTYGELDAINYLNLHLRAHE